MRTTVFFPLPPILSKYRKGGNFNHRNTFSISRIALSLHFVPKFEPDAVIGDSVKNYMKTQVEI